MYEDGLKVCTINRGAASGDPTLNVTVGVQGDTILVSEMGQDLICNMAFQNLGARNLHKKGAICESLHIVYPWLSVSMS